MNKLKKFGYFTAGWLSFLLGFIGVFLPILPTTPFMLLAAACFAKSSPRFHKWLLATRMFGPLIVNWQEQRFIAEKTKRNALLIIALTFGSSIWVVDVFGLRLMLFCFWGLCTFFISRLPTVPLSERRG